MSDRQVIKFQSRKLAWFRRKLRMLLCFVDFVRDVQFAMATGMMPRIGTRLASKLQNQTNEGEMAKF
jgi:hypothetical protein